MSVVMPYIVPSSTICTSVRIILCTIWYIVSDQIDFVRQLKAITGLDRPGKFQKFEAPRFQDNGPMKAAFTPRKYSWYSFFVGWKEHVSENFQWHHRESNPRPSGL